MTSHGTSLLIVIHISYRSCLWNPLIFLPIDVARQCPSPPCCPSAFAPDSSLGSLSSSKVFKRNITHSHGLSVSAADAALLVPAVQLPISTTSICVMVSMWALKPLCAKLNETLSSTLSALYTELLQNDLFLFLSASLNQWRHLLIKLQIRDPAAIFPILPPWFNLPQTLLTWSTFQLPLTLIQNHIIFNGTTKA